MSSMGLVREYITRDCIVNKLETRNLKSEISKIAKSTCPKSRESMLATGTRSLVRSKLQRASMKHPFFIPLTFFSFASTSNNMPLSLETKDGQSVDEASALKGKVVALYFSSSWCPACKTFTPLLSVLHEEAKEDDIPFEVVYVSSDRSTEDCTKYMKSSHGDWLKASWESRNSLKQEYGVFAGSEQALFPETKRRSGIPTLVVVDPDGKEQVLLDCDSPKVIKEIESKGTKFLDQWQQFKWN